MISWSEFHSILASAGFIPMLVEETHWRVLGGVKQIDVYLTDECEFASICIGEAATGFRKWKLESINQLLKIVRDGTIPKPKHTQGRPSRKMVKKHRTLLYQIDQRCHWCRVHFKTEEDATLDHVIPLSVGGINCPDNYVLSCEQCNFARGNRAINPDALVRHTIFAAIDATI